jgi:hypothetical protein
VKPYSEMHANKVPKRGLPEASQFEIHVAERNLVSYTSSQIARAATVCFKALERRHEVRQPKGQPFFATFDTLPPRPPPPPHVCTL